MVHLSPGRMWNIVTWKCNICTLASKHNMSFTSTMNCKLCVMEMNEKWWCKYLQFCLKYTHICSPALPLWNYRWRTRSKQRVRTRGRLIWDYSNLTKVTPSLFSCYAELSIQRQTQMLSSIRTWIESLGSISGASLADDDPLSFSKLLENHFLFIRIFCL
jgi:hypothetical protein